MRLKRLAPQISQRIDNEFNPRVLGEVLVTYACLDQEDTVERLTVFGARAQTGSQRGNGRYLKLLAKDASIHNVLQLAILSEDPEQRVLQPR